MSDAGEAWVVDDDRSIRWVLERALSSEGLKVIGFESAERLLEQLEHAVPDVIVSDIRMPEIDGLSLLESINSRYQGIPVIIMTAYSDS